MSAIDLGPTLIALARNAIERELAVAEEAVRAPGELDRPGATFVTLRSRGELRGCIGTLEAWRPLAEDVRANALAAAFRDPRFPPLRREELVVTAVEVSLLHPSEPVRAPHEDALLALLRPGIDGVVLECARRRATFLPQVWEQLPDAREFVRALKRKAGLPEDFWSEDVRISRYGVDKFAEETLP
ncbi:MAG: AmmeMemoRadiSam system protein A [Burkholderiales bacterium]